MTELFSLIGVILCIAWFTRILVEGILTEDWDDRTCSDKMTLIYTGAVALLAPLLVGLWFAFLLKNAQS